MALLMLVGVMGCREGGQEETGEEKGKVAI